MIVEVVDFKIDPAQNQAFGPVLKKAVQTVLSQAAGYAGHSVLACIETPGRYVLTVHWATLEDHTVGFRQSPAFTEWRALIGPFFVQPPHVEHFNVIDSRAPA